MKKIKIILFSLIFILLTSCTENIRAKSFGGDVIINIPKNNKVENITWKENQLWYSYRPMLENEQPYTQIFKENSSWGVLEGTVTFIESK